VDDRVREEALHRPVGEPPSFRLGNVRELEVVDPGRGDVANGRDPEETERLLDALGLRVQDPRFELDPYLDPDRRVGRAPDLPASLTEPER